MKYATSSVISFGREKLVEVYNEIKTTYCDKAMNRTRVLKWCGEDGHTFVHDDQRSGRPSIVVT